MENDPEAPIIKKICTCHEECFCHDCFVLKEEEDRDYSGFEKLDNPIPIFKPNPPDTWKEQVAFPTPSSTEEKKVMDIGLLTLRDRLRPVQKPGKIYTFADLPKQSFVPMKTLDICYIVRYSDPWDFNVILENGDHQLNNQSWRDYIYRNANSVNKSYFKSGLGLFRGFVYMLSRDYAENKGKVNDDVYKPGDLVICAVSRKPPYSLDDKLFGYRGVIINENFQGITAPVDVDGKTGKITKMSDLEKRTFLSVYLLDTGEIRIIEKGSEYLAPLPYAFTKFPPLAVNCAIHGVSPVGAEWNIYAKRTMARFVISKAYKAGYGTTLLAEFYSKESEQDTCDPQFSISSVMRPPYFVELVADFKNNGVRKYGDQTCFNVSTELIKCMGLGLEWNLFPDRAGFSIAWFDVQREKDINKTTPVELEHWTSDEDASKPDPEKERLKILKMKEDRRKMINKHRGIILHVHEEGNPRTIPVLSGDQIRFQMKNAFLANKELLGQLIQISEDGDDVDWDDVVLATRIPEYRDDESD